MKNKKILIVIVLLVAAGAWWFFGGSKDKTPPSNAPNVTVAPVTLQDIPITVDLVGNVIAYETVAIKSRLDSQIVEVNFKDGDFVTEGQTLFTLDDRAIVAQIDQFKASVEKEKANLANMELQYNRATQLRKTQVVAQATVDQAKAAYDAQVAQVGAAQANLDNAQVQLTYTKITAPISGRTGTINVTRGNNVKANDTLSLVTINQISPIRVQTAIAQRYYDQVKNALAMGDVKVIAQNKESATPVEGKLEYLDNAIDTTSGTFAARAVFANQDEKLWPGMFVNVTMDLGIQKNALTVPAVAVQGDEGKHFVFAVDEAGAKAKRVPVEVGINNGSIAVITSGLTDKDRVITDGILRVTDGSDIKIVDPNAPREGDDSKAGKKKAAEETPAKATP